MKSFSNIEKSGFKRGEYVGYAQGPWRIYKERGSSIYYAVKHQGRAFISASTLEEMNEKLIKWEQETHKGETHV